MERHEYLELILPFLKTRRVKGDRVSKLELRLATNPVQLGYFWPEEDRVKNRRYLNVGPTNRTVVVPVEYSEEPDTVSHLLNLLREVTPHEESTNATLWFNAAADLKDVAVPTFDWWAGSILTDVAEVHWPTLKVEFAKSFRKLSEKFNELRSDYMEAAIVMAYLRQDEVLYPVYWYDANTVSISRRTFPAMEKAMQEQQGYFILPNLQYTINDRVAFPLHERPDAERVAIIYAITRRMLERNLSPTDSRGYVEEPGMLVPLLWYLMSGGIATTDPTKGESKTMLARAEVALDPEIPLVWYVPEAIVRKSLRRFILCAEYGIPLADSEDGPDYKSYTDLIHETGPKRTKPYTNKEVRQMVRDMVAAQKRRNPGKGLTRKQWRHLRIIIKKCGFVGP